MGLQEALAANSVAGDGSISAEGLAALLRGLSGEAWDQDSAAKLVAGAGGDADGNVRLDSLLAWLFAPPCEAQEAVDTAVAASLEPMSPKILRRRDTSPLSPGFGDGTPPRRRCDASPTRRRSRAAIAELPPDILAEVDPTSPCVEGHILGNIGPASARRRAAEKRAFAYAVRNGERLFVPESYKDAVLLLRPDGTFAYVHTSQARFSEGVQGEYEELEGGSKVSLKPLDFGWCYEESFDEEEIIDTQFVLTLFGIPLDAGRSQCRFPDAQVDSFSWLNPTLPEDP